MTSNDRKHPPEGFLPYDLDYLPDDLKARAREELLEDDDTRESSLEQLRSKLREEKDLLFQDDDSFLLLFLRARKFNVQRAYQMVKNMYSIFGKYENIYYNFKFEDLQKLFAENSWWLSPYRDREGCVVFMFRMGTWNTEVNTLAEHLLCLTLGLHCIIRNPATQVAGVKAIADYSGFTVHHLMQYTLSNVWLVVSLLQNSIPARFRGVHIVNQNSLFTYLWRIASPLMAKKLRERFHFHGEDLQSLHEHLHPSILPAELGGELPPANSDDWNRIVMESEDYLNHVFSFGYKKYLKKAPGRREKEESPEEN